MVRVAKLCYQLVVIMFEDSGLTQFLINYDLSFLLGNAIVITIVAKCGLIVNKNQMPEETSMILRRFCSGELKK
ncbi:hypothetical protein Bca52824_002971 [Brassica carinata]|uniref:Uncharacterized protein n=1 Tax=Brassica carinata TaxID=52824 RepID=A0A8X7WLS4_BRACI|nr:hypothetical protein Bca52824_002971 [Brassica carinata]